LADLCRREQSSALGSRETPSIAPRSAICRWAPERTGPNGGVLAPIIVDQFARRGGPMKSICTRALVALCAAMLCDAAAGDEGMWTFNNFPSAKVAEKYGDPPTQPWLDHVRLSSVRISSG